MASKTLVGILVGCVVVAFVGVAIIIGGGWYVKSKIQKKVHEVSSQTAAELWSDVPPMDDLKRSDKDIPVGIKLHLPANQRAR